MSIETKTYPFRRGRSPSRYNASPMTRRKLKAKEEEDQAELDSIEVATYNDNPKHLYGKEMLSFSVSCILNLFHQFFDALHLEFKNKVSILADDCVF